MVSEENAQKALERAKLVVYEPNFKESIYDDPKKMYEDYCEYEAELATAIEQLRLASIDMMTRMIWWNEEEFIVNAFGGSLLKRNDSIHELYRLSKHLVYLRTEVRSIIQRDFEERFTFIEQKYGDVIYRKPETGSVSIFETKAEMIKHLRIEEEEFDELEPMKLTPTCFPILTNTLRFHGLNFKSDEFRTSLKFEVCRHCTELEDGKWAVVINYDCQ